MSTQAVSPRPRRYEPVDLLTMGYVVIVFLGVALLGGHLDRQAYHAGFHLGVFLVIRLGVPFGRRSRLRAVRFVTDFYPVLLYTFLYCEANLVNTLLFEASFDPFFRSLDRELFGVQPSFWLAETLGTPLVHEIVHALYFSYYLEILLVGLIVYGTRERAFFQRYLFTVCLTFYASYLFFIALPVRGPQLLRGADYHGFVFVPIMDFIYATAETGGGAFPSSHVAVALVGLIFCFRHSKGLGLAWVVPVAGLAFATVYCRYHYAVDTLAGLPWGLLFYFAGTRLFDRVARP